MGRYFSEAAGCERRFCSGSLLHWYSFFPSNLFLSPVPFPSSSCSPFSVYPLLRFLFFLILFIIGALGSSTCYPNSTVCVYTCPGPLPCANWTTPTVISNTSRGSNRTMTDVDLVMAGARTAIVYRNSYDGAIYFQQFTSGSINATSPFINISIPKSGCQLPSLALGADLDYLILMQCGSLSTANIYYSYGNASAGLSAAVTLSGTGLPLATIDQPLNVAVTSDGGQGWAATFLRPQVASGAFVVGLYSIGTLSSPQIYSFLRSYSISFNLRRASPSPFILFSAFSFSNSFYH